MDPLLGRELDGRYRLTAHLGQGAMGTVYRADRIDGGPPVAVKVLQEDCSDDPELRERFTREARALFGLQHANILNVEDYGMVGGQPYLVMELLQGRSLDEIVDAAPLPPDVAMTVARQFLSGLAYAHGQGVLHRDLKPENIQVSERADGALEAKLLDFGLVKFVDDERWGDAKKLTVAGSVMGSPAYMSPEQGTGAPMDARSDVYSAGIVLYELFTGAWPYSAESRMEMLKEHLLSPIPTIAAGRPGVDAVPELDAFLARAMAKAANERFADAREMLAAFEALPQPALRLREGAESSIPPPPGRELGSLPPRGRRAPMDRGAAASPPRAAARPQPPPAAPVPATRPGAAPARSSSPMRWVLLGVLALVGAVVALGAGLVVAYLLFAG
ncbi:MAG: serine/threonine-protein kinase [Sandaracinaceae bacterium]